MSRLPRLFRRPSAAPHAVSPGKGLLGSLGRCPGCMRSAFRSALAAWIVAAIVLASGWTMIGLALLSLGGGLTLLWLSHVSLYAFRRTYLSTDRPLSASRRALVATFGAVLFGAALATALPGGLARANMRYKACYVSCGGVDNYCCPETHPYMSWCDCLCYARTDHFDCSRGYVSCVTGNYCN